MKTRILSRLESQRRRLAGFTLTEIIIVMAIIGILSTVAITTLISGREKTRDTTRYQFALKLVEGLDLYHVTHGRFPQHGYGGNVTCQLYGQNSREMSINAPGLTGHYNQTCFGDIQVAALVPKDEGLFEIFEDPQHGVNYPGVDNFVSVHGGEYLEYLNFFSDSVFEGARGPHYCANGSSYALYIPIEQEDGAYCYIHSDNATTFSTQPNCTESSFYFWISGSEWDGEYTNWWNTNTDIVGSCDNYF